MAKLSIVLLLLVFVSTLFLDRVESNPTEFIKSSCKATNYPTLCVHCLTGYAAQIRQSHRQLAQTALKVSLSRARSASSFVSKLTRVRAIKPREYQAVRDCIENMGDTVDRLEQSVREMGQVGSGLGRDFLWHVGNVQTWVSAALTDETTCVDGFAGRFMDGNVKVAVRRRIVNVAQVTSNALALVNRFANSKRISTSSSSHHQDP